MPSPPASTKLSSPGPKAVGETGSLTDLPAIGVINLRKRFEKRLTKVNNVGM